MDMNVNGQMNKAVAPHMATDIAVVSAQVQSLEIATVHVLVYIPVGAVHQQAMSVRDVPVGAVGRVATMKNV